METWHPESARIGLPNRTIFAYVPPEINRKTGMGKTGMGKTGKRAETCFPDNVRTIQGAARRETGIRQYLVLIYTFIPL
ncbi:MAG: hypothetical protein LBQ12_11445 [Deltaproteobacteria bacterium]|nr:hypothetical protein [Deltaproteobacteria bacterium]